MTLALAKARDEVDASAEAARLAAARRDALDALAGEERAKAAPMRPP
jgi:chemotaxis protein MotB